jgi:hypothetical protein
MRGSVRRGSEQGAALCDRRHRGLGGVRVAIDGLREMRVGESQIAAVFQAARGYVEQTLLVDRQHVADVAWATGPASLPTGANACGDGREWAAIPGERLARADDELQRDVPHPGGGSARREATRCGGEPQRSLAGSLARNQLLDQFFDSHERFRHRHEGQL